MIRKILIFTNILFDNILKNTFTKAYSEAHHPKPKTPSETNRNSIYHNIITKI